MRLALFRIESRVMILLVLVRLKSSAPPPPALVESMQPSSHGFPVPLSLLDDEEVFSTASGGPLGALGACEADPQAQEQQFLWEPLGAV